MKLSDLDTIDLAALAELKVDVDTLLNEDAVLDLSYSTKVVYRLFSMGATDNEIAEQTGIPLNTIIWMRFDFWEKARSAITFSLLAREMAKGMPPKKTNKKSIGEDGLLPVIDDDGVVIDFAKDKYALHRTGDAARKHATVIILVGWIEPTENELSFIIVDKASKKLTESKGRGITALHAWETPGGHIEDVDGVELGTQLSMEMPLSSETEQIFLNTCVREGREEIYLKGVKRSSITKDQFTLLLIDHYDSVLDSNVGIDERNIEVSGVFLWKYKGKPGGMSSGDVRFCDQWRGSWLSDGIAKKEWVAKSRTYSDLAEEYGKHPHHFCDALARCLKAMREDAGLVERIEGLLR